VRTKDAQAGAERNYPSGEPDENQGEKEMSKLTNVGEKETESASDRWTVTVVAVLENVDDGAPSNRVWRSLRDCRPPGRHRWMRCTPMNGEIRVAALPERGKKYFRGRLEKANV
jgi:hypothetical protein